MPLIANHKMIGDARQIGMAQVGKDDRLKAKLARVFIRCKQILFNGNIHAQILIHRVIYRPHPALTENLNDAIPLV